MNKQLLDSLMQLLAVVAAENGIQPAEREVVRKYLLQDFNLQVADEYMRVFDAYAARVHELPSVHDLAELVAGNLTARDKHYEVIRLMELVGSEEEVSGAEAARLEEIAEVFGITGMSYFNLHEFVTTRAPRRLYHENLLIISSELGSARGKIIRAEHLVGYFAVLHIASVDMYLLRYIGNGDAYLNGQRLAPRHVYCLNSGSVIRAPHMEPVFFSDILDQFIKHEDAEYVRFDVQDVTYKFGGGKLGLHPITMLEESGRMVALMGASGAGKSTLLNVLNGSLKPTTGKVELNGFDIHTQAGQLNGVIGYVSQDDLLLEELSVFQNLYLNAKLCFKWATPDELTQLADATLMDLGLFEIRDLQVGSVFNKKISGGQRKRLNIALELIRQPLVLFVDEPTSGLSSRDSENVMDLLKVLSRQGKLVFVVIHQPSSDVFKLFDRLLVLDTGGYPVFYGKPLQALGYFREQMNHVSGEAAECPACGNVNPEQIFNLLEERVVDEFGNLTHVRKMAPAQWHAIYQEHNPKRPPAQPKQLGKPSTALRLASWGGQFGVFLKRDVLSKLRNTSYLLINVLEAPVLALLLALILRYFDPSAGNAHGYTLANNENLPSYLFISVLVALFIGLTVSAEEILRDRRARRREAFLHLSRSAYLLAKVGLLFGVSALQMALFVWLGNSILVLDGLGWEHWLMLFSTACFANMLGLNVSATFDSAVTIYILVPLLLIPQIVLSGAIVRFDRLNPSLADVERVPLSGQLMASRWAYEALAVEHFTNNAYQRNFYAADRLASEAKFVLNFWIPEVKKRVDEARGLLGVGAEKERFDAVVATLSGALSSFLARFPNQAFPFLEGLRQGQFTENTAAQIERALDALRVRFGRQQRRAMLQRDGIYQWMASLGLNPDSLRRAHHNEALEDIVTNRAAPDRVAEIDNKLVQLSDPVYKSPPATAVLGFDAHFYAPTKRVLGAEASTFAYNVVVLWLMCLVLYATLYAELFRKIIKQGSAIVRLRTTSKRLG